MTLRRIFPTLPPCPTCGKADQTKRLGGNRDGSLRQWVCGRSGCSTYWISPLAELIETPGSVPVIHASSDVTVTTLEYPRPGSVKQEQ